MQAVRAKFLRHSRVPVLAPIHGNQCLFCASLFSTDAKSSFLNKGEATYRVVKVLKPFQNIDPSKPWQTAVYRAGSNSVFRPYYEVCAPKAFNFSSVASPVAEKDAEEGTSTSEEVKPAANDATQKVETEEASKTEPGEEQAHAKQEEDNEAVLKLVAERQAQLDEKGKQLGELKQRVLSSMAELESVKERLRREAESTKKYAIQDFAKSLLDVADNLGRAVATVAENVRKVAAGNTTSETAKFLKSLLEGVITTEKELMKVLKKFGVEKFEPVGEQFDPNSHLALFEVPDPSKEAGTVAVVVKAGYMLHDRVLRPAEVGVVRSLE